MARVFLPYILNTVPSDPNSNNPNTGFNPLGKGSHQCSFRTRFDDLTISDTLYNASGYLTSDTILVDNTISSSNWLNNQNWKIYIDTQNRVRFQFWFYDNDSGLYYYTTETQIKTSSSAPTNLSTGYIISGLTVTKGKRYDFSAAATSATSFNFILMDRETGTTQSKTLSAKGWKNSYTGKHITVGAPGVSCERMELVGYDYNEWCVTYMYINDETYDGTSNVVRGVFRNDCGWDRIYHSYTSPYIHKVSVVLPTSVANLANASAASGSVITWQDGIYNFSTRTWTKYFGQGEKLNFPTIWAYINNDAMNNTASDHGINNPGDCMFLGYSTSNGGALTYNDWDTYYMGTSDITIYPRIATFGPLTGTSLGDCGIKDYLGPALDDGTLRYAVIRPNAANATYGTVAASGLKIWSAGEENSTQLPSKGAPAMSATSSVVVASTTAGTNYNILPGEWIRNRYIYRLEIKSNTSQTTPVITDPDPRVCGYYRKPAYAIMIINTVMLPKPTKGAQLTYNGSTQTQVFNNYDPTYMTAQYISNKDAGTYTAIFTLKDTVMSHWADDTTDQILVTWSIEPKLVTPTFGTTAWVFDGQPHSTTYTLSGVVNGDSCNLILSGNTITNPGSTTVMANVTDNSNYKSVSSVMLTVTKRQISLTWDNTEKIYDGYVLTPTVTASGYVQGYVPTVVGSASTSANIGYYTSTASFSSYGAYYSLPTTATHDLHIMARPVEITWDPVAKNYDGTTLTSIPTITNLVSGDSCSMTKVRNTIGPNASSQLAEVTALGNSNYTLEGATGKTQLIIIREILDPEHGKVYTWTGSAWQRIM